MLDRDIKFPGLVCVCGPHRDMNIESAGKESTQTKTSIEVGIQTLAIGPMAIRRTIDGLMVIRSKFGAVGVEAELSYRRE